MIETRCQEALKMLRQEMQASLHDDPEFAPTFDDLVYWSQVVWYGLGELRELGEIETEIARPRRFVEHLYARAERVVRAVKDLRGNGTLVDVLAALAEFDASSESTASELIGRGQLDRWVSIRRWADAFRSGLWRFVDLAWPRREGEER